MALPFGKVPELTLRNMIEPGGSWQAFCPSAVGFAIGVPPGLQSSVMGRHDYLVGWEPGHDHPGHARRYDRQAFVKSADVRTAEPQA